MDLTLVLGASLKKNRYSNLVINKLLDSDKKVVAIGGKEGVVHGVIVHTEKIPLKNIDTVTMYLNPSLQKEYYNFIVTLKPRRVIFNPGTENQEFYAILKSHNISFEIACTLVLLSTNQY